MNSQMFHCEHCNTTMTGAEPYKTHIEGKKHLKKLKALGLENGSVVPSTNNQAPNTDLANPGDSTLTVSQQDPYNAAAILGTTNTDPVMNAVQANLLGQLPTKPVPYDKKCDICDVEFSSKLHEDQHMAGKKHQKKVKTIQDQLNGVKMHCEACNVFVNSSEQMVQHELGEPHKKKIGAVKKTPNHFVKKNPNHQRPAMEPAHSVAKKQFVPAQETSRFDENSGIDPSHQPHSAPSYSAPPHSAPPHSAPPYSAPPYSAPPHSVPKRRFVPSQHMDRFDNRTAMEPPPMPPSDHTWPSYGYEYH